uniref:CSON014049 protein n=1 Tax=Culicoides sonorensis TaxID=179676 RepID=A0A336MDJ4_CULSO
MSSSLKKAWREAATLIIAAKSSSPIKSTSAFDYRILCMKRSEKTSFLSNNISYPGGALEEQDQNINWFEQFAKFGVSKQDLDTLTLDYHKQKQGNAFIFQDKNENIGKKLPKSVSLRIGVIRETFEELGVLLCRQKTSNCKFNQRLNSNYMRGIDIISYQKQVHDRKITFLEMCDQLNIIPDVFSLFEWSAWLTPTFFSARRFETAFFLCTLNDQPPVYPEQNEAFSYFWRSPLEYIQMLRQDVVWYHPPQLYEFTRLANLTKIEEVLKFASKREVSGSILYMPVLYKCTDGMVFTLPGDDVYPPDPKYVEDDPEARLRTFGGTMEGFRKMSSILNRIEMKSPSEVELHSNCETISGHLRPKITLNESVDQLRPKL